MLNKCYYTFVITHSQFKKEGWRNRLVKCGREEKSAVALRCTLNAVQKEN